MIPTVDRAVDVRARNNVRVLGNSEGPVLVFSHGFGCSQEVWKHVIPAFLDEYSVVLFDHVGAGGSDLAAYDRGKYDSLYGYADDILEIIAELGLRDVVFVGHSVSAMMGVLAANRAPELFSRLVLIGPSPRYINDDDYIGGFEADDIRSLLDALDLNYLGWSSTMAPMIMGNPERPELGDELTSSFCRTDPEIAQQFADVTFLSDNRRDLRDVSVPTLIVQCTDDIIAPFPVGDYVHQQIAGSTLVVIPAKGHIPTLSEPAQVVEAITAYLNS